MLSEEELIRYSRQLIMPEFEERGQEILLSQKILIVGAGGLGCPVGMYCSAAGFGNIEIWDNDVIELSNLNRQVAHQTNEIGLNKAASLEKKCKLINSSIKITSKNLKFEQSSNIKKFDLIFDCTDNIDTRYKINKLAHINKKLLISGSATQLEGQVLVLKSGLNEKYPCYECVFPRTSENSLNYNCREVGILGSITSFIGSIQVTEAIREIFRLNNHKINAKKKLYLEKSNAEFLILYDASLQEMNKIKLNKNIKCKICN